MSTAGMDGGHGIPTDTNSLTTELQQVIHCVGKHNNLSNISPRSAIHFPRRVIMLEVDKYAPDESPKWKRVNARFPALYKALLVEPDAATHGARLRQAVIAAR